MITSKFKRYLSGLLAPLMVLTLLPTTTWAADTVASGTCGDNLTWTLDDEGTLSISGSGAMDCYYYYGEAPWYNNCNTIKSVVIKSGVTSISNGAFGWCDGLTSVSIPDSVTSIGEMAFYLCHELTSVSIGNGVTSIGSDAFNQCVNLTSITIPDSVTSIGVGAFWHCHSLTNIAIPNGVTSIGDSAFEYCIGLSSITIPNSVTSIGDRAFSECTSLSSIQVASGNPNYSSSGILFNKAKTELICCPGGFTGSYTIPNSVTSISDFAFFDCAGLTSISIPGGVISIGHAAFCACNNLTDVTIPNSVTSIGDHAFLNCDNLANVYYTGSKTQWNKISIGSDNEPLTGATIHYNWAPAVPKISSTTVASSGAIKLTWSKVDGAARYYIYRSTDGGKNYKYYDSTTKTTYTNTSVTPGKTYYYKLKAVGEDGTTSKYSNVVYRTADCARPDVTITRSSSGKPLLKWKAITGAEEYVIYRATSKTGTYTKMYTTTKLSYTNTSAKAGTTYYYKVMAICAKSS